MLSGVHPHDDQKEYQKNKCRFNSKLPISNCAISTQALLCYTNIPIHLPNFYMETAKWLLTIGAAKFSRFRTALMAASFHIFTLY